MLIFLDKHFGTMTVDNTIYSLVHFQTNPALSDTLTNIHYIPSVWQPCWASATGLEQKTTAASPTPSFQSYIISQWFNCYFEVFCSFDNSYCFPGISFSGGGMYPNIQTRQHTHTSITTYSPTFYLEFS